MNTLYKVNKKDVRACVATLKDAFKNDPLWNRVFRDDPNKDKALEAFFTIPVLYGLKYGKVYAVSERIEGVAVWLPGEKSRMGFWGILRSGAISCGAAIGKSSMNGFSALSKQLEPDRKRIMAGKKYIYLSIIGVHSEYQGKGYGTLLLDFIKAECDENGYYMYLETETQDNVGFYEKHGFYTEQIITVAGIDLPIWEMVRPPQSRK